MKTILLAKKRKGGWVMLADPDVSHSSQAELRKPFLSCEHEEYATVMCLRADEMTAVFATIRLQTKKEIAESKQRREENRQQAIDSQEAAKQREKERIAALEKEEDSRRLSNLSRINEINDRARTGAVKAA